MGRCAIQTPHLNGSNRNAIYFTYTPIRGQQTVYFGEYQMERGSVFMTNRTQAIRLPKSMRLPDGVTSVDIVRRGRAWVIVPSNESWAEWFEGETVSDDFMGERDQPEAQERDAL